MKKPGIVIKGALAAGGLVEPFTDEQSTLSLAHIHDSNSYYALRMKGNNLRDSAIADEDTVIIRRLTPEDTVRDGEIVAVKVENHGVSLRRYNYEKEPVILASLDKETFKKVPRTVVEIQGVVVGIWRNNELGFRG
ncbi:MAG: LexA family protein [Crocosphaera sp.]